MAIWGNQQNKADNGYALPTVLILSFVLLIISLSTFQAGVALSRSILDQHWNRLAKQAMEAGVAYATSCAKQLDTSWSGLAPNKECNGNTITGRSQYYAHDISSSPRWRATYTVSNVQTNSGLYGESTATITGQVDVLRDNNINGIATRSYKSKTTAFVNQEVPSYKRFSVVQANSGVACVLISKDDPATTTVNEKNQLYCTPDRNTGTMTRFPIPASEIVLDYRMLYTDTNLTVQGVCALTNLYKLYCMGPNYTGELANGTRTAVAYNSPTVFSKSASEPVLVKELWTGTNVLGNMCVLSVDTKMYCAGRNAQGTFGNGTKMTNPYNDALGDAWAVESFNTGNYFNAGSSLRVKRVYAHITIPTNSPQGLLKSTQLYNPITYRRCVLATDDQIYCAGACTSWRGGLLFGTARAGNASNIKGCGKKEGASNSPASVFESNPAPNGYSGDGSGCYGSKSNGAVDGRYGLNGETDDRADCYLSPVKFQLPVGLKVRQVRITQNNTLSSSLCAYASNAKTYCTFSDYLYNYELHEPTNMETI